MLVEGYIEETPGGAWRCTRAEELTDPAECVAEVKLWFRCGRFAGVCARNRAGYVFYGESAGLAKWPRPPREEVPCTSDERRKA